MKTIEKLSKGYTLFHVENLKIHFSINNFLIVKLLISKFCVPRIVLREIFKFIWLNIEAVLMFHVEHSSAFTYESDNYDWEIILRADSWKLHIQQISKLIRFHW